MTALLVIGQKQKKYTTVTTLKNPAGNYYTKIENNTQHLVQGDELKSSHF